MRGRQQNSREKLKIRSFPPKQDESYLDQLWEKLKTAIKEIQKKNNSGLSFEELYRNAYTMVLNKQGQHLYRGTQDVIKEHLITTVRDKVLNKLDDRFLHELESAWREHHTAMVMIRDILMYMDRVYCITNNMRSVYQSGLHLFRDHVLMHDSIRGHLENELLDMIDRERAAILVDRPALKSACKMLVELDTDRSIYKHIFEDKFLANSATFYSNEAESLLLQCSAGEYVEKVKARMNEESDRALNYLDKETQPAIVAVLRRELLEAHMQRIVRMEGSGVVWMLENDKLDLLETTYTLFENVEGGVKCISDCVSEYLVAQGNAIVEKAKKSRDWLAFVKNLIELKSKFDTFLVRSFGDNRVFRQSIATDFERFVNDFDKSAEFLSLFIDNQLKKSKRGSSEDDVDDSLERALMLFRYLHDKDVFEGYYKVHLAKRLIHGKNANDDQEKMMISKLKNECGCYFTNKLEGMFKDMEVSTNLNDEYKQEQRINSVAPVAGGGPREIDISVQVLTQGHWPYQSGQQCTVPQLGERAFDAFRNFYLDKHSGRKLQLHCALGNAELLARFYPSVDNDENTAAVSSSTDAPKKHTLVVPTYMMIILMLFNKKPAWSFTELLAETSIPERELMRQLASITYMKSSQKILRKISSSSAASSDSIADEESTDAVKSIKPDDIFMVNDGFTSRLHKVRVVLGNTKAGTDGDGEKSNTRLKVDEDRNYEIDAAVVRTMKARQRLNHNTLIEQVTNQVRARFLPSPAMIKRRIETLLEREYIERCEADRSMYKYVA